MPPEVLPDVCVICQIGIGPHDCLREPLSRFVKVRVGVFGFDKTQSEVVKGLTCGMFGVAVAGYGDNGGDGNENDNNQIDKGKGYYEIGRASCRERV